MKNPDALTAPAAELLTELEKEPVRRTRHAGARKSLRKRGYISFTPKRDEVGLQVGTYSITDAGRERLAQHRAELAELEATDTTKAA
jgi:hypothetical protein